MQIVLFKHPVKNYGSKIMIVFILSIYAALCAVLIFKYGILMMF